MRRVDRDDRDGLRGKAARGEARRAGDEAEEEAPLARGREGRESLREPAQLRRARALARARAQAREDCVRRPERLVAQRGSAPE
jgi:vacuolar-type H+-ATPase subunit E/Vma4